MNMYKTGMLLTEDDAKKVAHIMETQITGLNKEREAAKLERALEQVFSFTFIVRFEAFMGDVLLVKSPNERWVKLNQSLID